MPSIQNLVIPILTQSSLMSTDHIETLNLFHCDRSISLKLPLFPHVNLIDSFDALRSFPLVSTNIRSSTIVMHQTDIQSATERSNDLRTLNALPHFRSVRLVFYSTLVCSNDTGCQMLAKIFLSLSDFDVSFREDRYATCIVLSLNDSIKRWFTYHRQVRNHPMLLKRMVVD